MKMNANIEYTVSQKFTPPPHTHTHTLARGVLELLFLGHCCGRDVFSFKSFL